MHVTTVRAGQCLQDIAVQEAGSLVAVFDVAILAGLSLTDVPNVGQRLEVPDELNERIVNVFLERSLFPATWTDQDDVAVARGIGVMKIRSNFIVG